MPFRFLNFLLQREVSNLDLFRTGGQLGKPPTPLRASFATIQIPDKTNFRGPLRNTHVQIFGPTLRRYADLRRARSARRKNTIGDL